MNSPVKLETKGRLEIINLNTKETLFDSNNSINDETMRRIVSSRLANGSDVTHNGITILQIVYQPFQQIFLDIDEYNVQANEVTFIKRIGPDYPETTNFSGLIQSAALNGPNTAAASSLSPININKQQEENIQFTWKIKFNLI